MSSSPTTYRSPPLNSSPSYVRGYTGLGMFLGMTAKSARALDGRIIFDGKTGFPKHRVPGVKKETLLFKISDIEKVMERYRADREEENVSVDVAGVVARVLGNVASGKWKERK